MKRFTIPDQIPIDWDAKPEPIAEAPKPPRKPRVVRGICSRLPVPKPMREAVRAGHFGHDDDGKPIRPEADEVRAITESHADRLIHLLDINNPARFKVEVDLYARDFGEVAAKRLEANARRRQASEDEEGRSR